MDVEITIHDTPTDTDGRPLYELLLEQDAGGGWCWIEGHGFFIVDTVVSERPRWRRATNEEIADIRNENTQGPDGRR